MKRKLRSRLVIMLYLVFDDECLEGMWELRRLVEEDRGLVR
jgi:hypothetical protein